ncbi:phage tail protein I [Kamptonema formosum]|uniref:phage tail protein I n=1 Tax=Kamptonema formosum TaxID=331992 RepID=UPI0003605FDE|nr:phage tail protein I [Oscillatoria sp. PCC 10802]
MTENSQSGRLSSYLQYLPAHLQSDAFVGRFLLAMERILTGLTPGEPDDIIPEQYGLEEYLDRIDTYFNAEKTPADFLPWLASWVAASLREDWDESFKRQFIGNIATLYRLRGTKAGVKRLLELYTREEVKIYEFDLPAHYFQVDITLSERDPQNLRRQQQIAKTILDLQKPAHTFYRLQVLLSTMQIKNNDLAKGIIVGRTTLLGTTTIR